MSHFKPGDKVFIDFGDKLNSQSERAKDIHHSIATVKGFIKSYIDLEVNGSSWWLAVEYCKPFGMSLKPGDKALLKFDCSDDELEGFDKEVLKLNNTVVTIKYLVSVSGVLLGLYIDKIDVWLSFKHFQPLPNISVIVNSSLCQCSSPNLITNYADGKKFYFCRCCKKEYI